MNLFRRNRDLDDELRAHLAFAINDRIARGESPSEAERNARRELGNVALVKEVTRGTWRFAALERLGRNLAFALRQLRRAPVFTAVSLLTLALGLGTATVMFSLVNGVLLEPLPFHDPARLYLARTIPPPDSGLNGNFPINARHYYEWRTHCRACASVSLLQFEELTLTGAGEPIKLPALGISSNFFPTLGAAPALGRGFLAEEDAPGHFGEVILSDALWRSRFSADPHIVGRTIELNGEAHIVVGVMPANLHLPKGNEWGSFFGPSKTPLLFRPLGIDASQARPIGNLNYTCLIRLNPGVSPTQATAALNSLLADFVRQYRLETKIILIPFQQQVTGASRAGLWLLLAMVATVLLIVCVNVGNLMLVRTAGRYREAAIRLALGAGRAHLFSMVLTEALALVLAGSLAGLALASAALRSIAAAAPASIPRLDDVHLDGRVLAFAVSAAAVSTLLSGLLPAWRLSRIAVQDSLKAGAATSTETAHKLHVRELLVALEVALSTTLLVAGGLLTLSFFRLTHTPKGFDTANIVTLDVSYLSPQYAHGVRRRYVEETIEKLAQIPGVQAAAAINLLPLRGDDWFSGLEDPDRPAPPASHAAFANFRFVTPQYWRAMGIPLLEGRYLNASDKGRPTAVISEQAAAYLWPNQDPIGRHVLGVGSQSPSLEVVGVVGDVRAKSLDENPPMIVYEHYWRIQPIGMSFLVRTPADPSSTARAMRSILSSLDPEMAIPHPVTMRQIVGDSVAGRRLQMDLAAAFALFALLLASLATYAVIAFAVARRTPELGIRAALGARPLQLMAMVLLDAMRPVLLGLLAGLACALSLTRFLATQLFGVTPYDPLTIAAVATIVLAVAALACLTPARRAARIDPLTALRFE